MPVIESIEKIKRKKGYYNVRIENGLTLPVDEVLILKYGLREGTNLTQSQVSELKIEAEFEFLYRKALDILSRRPHSEKELFRKLKFTPVFGHHADDVIKKLKRLKFIDDTAFASAMIHTSLLSGAKGRLLMKKKLLQKGVPRSIAEKVMDSELSEYDERQAAIDLARKKLVSLEKLPPDKAKQRLAMFLSGRGFDWDTIREAIEKTMDKRY